MKKALPASLLLFFVFSILTITTASANEGRGGKSTPPAAGAPELARKDWKPESVDSRFSRNRGWFSAIWEDIRNIFDSRRPHYERPAPGSSWHEGSNSPAGSNKPGSPSAPIDGGISLLLAAGIGLGVKKARERYKAGQPKAGAVE